QAYVTGMQAADPWTKVGVMIRDTLAADAANVSALVSATNGISLQYRSVASGSTTQVTTSGLSAPYWVKVTRVGNAFSAYRSTDGTNWTQLGTTQTITMGSSVYIGIAATSHNSSIWAQGSLSNVTAVP
ncbi:MAG TPA: hypothetical protein VNB29_08250, partial [Chthoniobacterales bacterium]|nr:hypothetical protein [Chthoniobacterales bacterium]